MLSQPPKIAEGSSQHKASGFAPFVHKPEKTVVRGKTCSAYQAFKSFSLLI
jgi:hypothetical protein